MSESYHIHAVTEICKKKTFLSVVVGRKGCGHCKFPTRITILRQVQVNLSTAFKIR